METEEQKGDDYLIKMNRKELGMLFRGMYAGEFTKAHYDMSPSDKRRYTKLMAQIMMMTTR